MYTEQVVISQKIRSRRETGEESASFGTVITPVADSRYDALFDEQEMYPEVKTYLTGTMFDEVYHGRTAYEFIHGLVTYETTHPQLGKVLIALGVRIFGMTPHCEGEIYRSMIVDSDGIPYRQENTGTDSSKPI